MLASGIPLPTHIFFTNHASSLLDPDFISSYIASEQAAGRYSEAYTPDALESIIGPFRTSPLGLVPKPHSSKLRLVQDMSFPRNDPNITSVNAGVNSDDFPTSWGTFDSTAELILSLPPGCVAATFDISAAYRLTPVHPSQQHALCIFWNGLVYVDRAVMFGLTSSAGVFGAVVDMLVAIYGTANFGLIQKWVDDFLAIRLPHQSWTETEFMDLTGYFGVPWSIEKLHPFSSIQRYIGFDWNLERKSVALPKEKLRAMQLLVKEWQHPGASFSAREAASLHGKLVHVSCIFPLIRPFLRSISLFSQNFTSPRAKLHATSSVQHDLSWIHFLLHQLPNAVPLMNQELVDLNWWGDASTSFGIGVVLGKFFAVWKYAPGFQVGPKKAFNIGWAEAVAVELGLRLAIQFRLLRASNILVRSDNSGIVTVMNKVKANVRPRTMYVSSRDNISDALSRGQVSEFLQGFPLARTQVVIPLPKHLIDKLTPWP